MSEANVLRPCHICGGVDIELYAGYEHELFDVTCNDCGNGVSSGVPRTDLSYTEEHDYLIKLWNTMTAPTEEEEAEMTPVTRMGIYVADLHAKKTSSKSEEDPNG